MKSFKINGCFHGDAFESLIIGLQYNEICNDQIGKIQNIIQKLILKLKKVITAFPHNITVKASGWYLV